MKMSNREIDDILKKIKEEYQKGMKKYGESFYNLDAFRDRYVIALKEKHNLPKFLVAEIKVLDEIRKKTIELESIKKTKNKEKPKKFQDEVDKILANYHNAIVKYPKKCLHMNMDEEICYLYGAFKELYEYFLVLKSFTLYSSSSSGYSTETVFKNIEYKFDLFVLEIPSSKCPKIYSDYILSLESKKNIILSEQFILKESGFFLNSFVKRLEQVKHDILELDGDSKIIFQKENSTHSKIYKIFSNKSKNEVYDIIINYAKGMINDFRLQSFKKENY